MIFTQKSDTFGIVTSTLCLIHCLATPFIFVAHSSAACCASTTPSYWKFLDYIFLFISFLAVYWSAKNTSKEWVRYGFWSIWGALTLVILNEKFGWFAWPETLIYIPTLGLVALHFYNRRFCQCEEEQCCANLDIQK